MRNRLQLLMILSLAALALAASPLPQPDKEAEPIESEIKEEVQVRLVQMPLLAIDRQGRPVGDLEADEIVVKDRGEKRQVAYLQPLHSAAREAEPLPDVRLFVDVPGGSPEPVTATGSDAERLMFLIDVENDYLLRRDEALETLLDFVAQLAPSTLAAVLSFDGGLRLELPFTADREALAGALRAAWYRRGKSELNLSSKIAQLVDRFEDCVSSGNELSRKIGNERCLQDVAREHADETRPRAEAFLDGLEDLIQYASGLEARKTVLAVSHGVAVDPTPEIAEAMRAVFGNSEQISRMQLYLGFGDRPQLKLDQVLRLAIEKKVTLNFVDRSLPPTGDTGARRGHALQPGAKPMQAAFNAAQANLTEIASATGGVFVSSPDFQTGLQKAMASQHGGYELGYYVDDILSGKRMAKVTVEATRKGVRLVHRRGYYVQAATLSTPTNSRILLEASEPPDAGAPARFRQPFRVEIDPNWIGYEPAEDQAVANFTLHLIVRTFAGRQLADSYHFINHSYPRELWDAKDVYPVTIGGWVELPPGAYTIVAVLRNTKTGREGQLTNAVELGPVEPTSQTSSP